MSEKNVQVRPRRDDDVPALARALVAVHREDGYPVEGVDDPEAWLCLDGQLGAWTAALDGEPVGHVAMTTPGPGDGAAAVLHRQTGIELDQLAVVGRLFVSPEARGNGLARRLMDMVENEAGQRSLTLVLDVMEKDRAAIGLYESRGWRRIGSMRHDLPAGEAVPAYALTFTR